MEATVSVHRIFQTTEKILAHFHPHDAMVISERLWTGSDAETAESLGVSVNTVIGTMNVFRELLCRKSPEAKEVFYGQKG